MNQGRQLEERIGPAGFTVTSVTPKRISARLSIQIEDVGTVGQANFESILRENLALVLADELDKQAINGDCSAPNLTGIFQRPANPSAPGAVADFDAYAAAHAGGVDGLWAHTIKRSFAAFAYAARSWSRERRVVARLEATTRGFDARYIVTSLSAEPRHLYEDIYCARGQAENLIKLHKGQLASDRTSCQSPLANQLRLVLHTAAYWLMLALRDAVPRTMPLARAEFATLRLRLLKIGARVVEKAARIRIHFTSACPDAALFRLLAGRLAAAGP